MTADRTQAPAPPANIVLIGYRGCGKTTVGRSLANRLGWTFVDTDERIEARAGRSIRDIFAANGEPAFRALEAQVVADLARGQRQVLSVGGGAVLAEANRRRLAACGVCFWLTASPETLHQRMQADRQTAVNRPPLTSRDALDEVRHLLNQRAPLYAALAQHVVDTAGRSVGQIVDDITARL